MAKNICAGRGYVGPSTKAIPSDPTVYSARGQRDIALCSRLRCSHCGEEVRSFDDVFFEGRVEELFAAYEAQAVDQLPPMEPFSLPTRLYLCRCMYLNAGSEKPLSLATELGHEDLPARWGCSGHVPVKLLMTYDGVPLAAKPDWLDVVQTTFREVPDPAAPHRWPRWINGLYQRLGGTKHQGALDDAATALLEGDDPLLVSRAIDFYWGSHGAPGTKRLRTLALEAGDRLAALADPLGPSDLHHKVLRAVAFHISTSGWDYDAPLQAVFRAHVETPGHLGALALFFSEEDEEWLAENRDRLLTISPDAAALVDRWMS